MINLFAHPPAFCLCSILTSLSLIGTTRSAVPWYRWHREQGALVPGVDHFKIPNNCSCYSYQVTSTDFLQVTNLLPPSQLYTILHHTPTIFSTIDSIYPQIDRQLRLAIYTIYKRFNLPHSTWAPCAVNPLQNHLTLEGHFGYTWVIFQKLT